jgi:hypothetical protein
MRTQLMFVAAAVAAGVGVAVAGAVGDGVMVGLAGAGVAGEVCVAVPWSVLDSRSVAFFSLTSLMPTISPTAMVTISGRAMSMIRFRGIRSPDHPSPDQPRSRIDVTSNAADRRTQTVTLVGNPGVRSETAN